MTERDEQIQKQVVFDVLAERQRQDEKWGEQNHGHYKWNTIIGEEYGEVCRASYEIEHSKTSALLARNTVQYRKELIECAACCIAAVECFDRNASQEPTT